MLVFSITQKLIMDVTKLQKNGSLHIHTLLWLTNSPNPNTFIQTLHDDKIFPQNMINYLNDIITQDINHYNSCPIMTNINYIDYNLINIHPCTTRPLDPKGKFFTKLF
jgi:hypothetical protein